MKVEIAPFSVKFDGVEQKHLQRVEVRVVPDGVPEVDAHFLQLMPVEVLGGEVSYLAWADGCHAQAGDIPTTLRLLADIVEANARAQRGS